MLIIFKIYIDIKFKTNSSSYGYDLRPVTELYRPKTDYQRRPQQRLCNLFSSYRAT